MNAIFRPVLAEVGSGVNFVKVIIILVLVGVLMWAINTYVTMLTPGWKKLINIVAAVLVALWLMSIFGIWEYLSSVHS